MATRHHAALMLGLLAGGVALAACGSDDTEGDAAAGCDALVSAICGKLDACFHAVIGIYFGDADTCRARVAIDCKNEIAGPGTGFTAAYAQSCAAAYDAASCVQVPRLFAGLGDCTAPSGSLGDGEACGNNTQCESGYCRGDGGGICGTCADRLSGGGACNSNPAACPPGNTCGPSGQCIILGQSGDSCSEEAPCASLLHCVQGSCTLGQSGGEPCNEGAPCALAQGLACDSTSTCHTFRIAPPGAECGIVGSDLVYCGVGSECDDGGKCAAAGEEGAPCGGANGDACLSPAQCAGGTCKLVDSCF